MDISNFPQFGIFCDESSQTGHRFIVIGALFCHADVVPVLRTSIREATLAHGGTSELKWEKVKRRNLPMYRDVIQTIFDFHRSNLVHYYALVVDTSRVDHKRFNDGDAELGFNKFLFTLLFKFARRYRQQPRFYTLLDGRTTRHSPEKLRDILNARVRRDLQFGYDPYRAMRFVDSKEDYLIQAVDVLTGAVAYQTNGHHLVTGAAAHKIEAARLVAKLAGVPSLALPTQQASRTFDIWHLDFAKSRKK